MNGLMMTKPLTVSSLISHAACFHADAEIISVENDGSIVRTNYASVEQRARKLASALEQVLSTPGSFVGTLGWNNFRHLEIYFAVSGSGNICHTVNPRLSAEQLVYVINQAEDELLFIERSFLPLIVPIVHQLETVKYFVVMDALDNSQVEINHAISYENLLATGTSQYCWPELDENTASSLCYTSGTTSLPKGVLYSHRSTVLHANVLAHKDGMAIGAQDTVMPVVPMFHVTAWGIPYAAAMTGCKLVMPGPKLDGVSLMNLINAEKVTMAAGVPTLWNGLLDALKETNQTLPTLERTVVGGSSCPPSMIKAFREQYDVQFVHAWGMTETSPLGTLNQPKAKHQKLSEEKLVHLATSQGRPPFGVELRIQDDEGTEIPNDGNTQGNLMIRGHWVINQYFKQEKTPLEDGWFPTGDIATLDADGYLLIRDRSKDLIKSGGEWISSVDLENIALSHPGVEAAAAIAVKHEKWAERPYLVIVPRVDYDVSASDILDSYEGKVPRWWHPDDVAFVNELPRNATGKVLKNKLRAEFENTLLEK